MGKKRTYQTVDIKSLDVPRLLEAIAAAVVVSIDVAKASFVAAISTVVDGVIRIVRFEHPTETRSFLDLLVKIKRRAKLLTVLMEPTGTYGDALRYQLELLEIDIRMIQPKRTHDAKEAFDGVPSKLDPKDTVTMVKLHEAGASTRWVSPDEQRRAFRAMFDQHLAREARCEALYSQIEARLARHWPELEAWLSVRKHASARILLQDFGSPQNVAANPEGARGLLRRASRGALSPELIDGVIESARTTLGVPMIAEEKQFLGDLVGQLIEEIGACEKLEERVQELVKNSAEIQWMRGVVGIMAATAIVTFLGLPKDYPGARAFLKAAGLNVRESSSGTRDGNVHITKRGPAVVRKLLYMAALRAIPNDPVARAWYRGRRAFVAKEKTGAVVALMRKLLAAAYHVGKHHVPYDASKLFDTRRLDYTPTAESIVPRERATRRTRPRSIARAPHGSRRDSAGGASI